MRIDDFSKKQAAEANRLWALQMERGADTSPQYFLDSISTLLSRLPSWAEGRDNPAPYGVEFIRLGAHCCSDGLGHADSKR